MTVFMFFAGLALLVIGADILVRGASKFAISFGISPLVVGLTIVAFGTSAPEVAVSVGAVLQKQTDIAIGNVVGSNIFNVLFILGVSALITPLVVNAQIIRQEVPIMIGASLLLLAVSMDGKLGIFDGLILCVLLIVYTTFLIYQSRSEPELTKQEYSKYANAKTWSDKKAVQILLIVFGLILLVLGSKWLVSSAINFAKYFGVSDLVIGLTIVAAGTSMPEVATSIVAAVKGQRDIAVGNVIGSNTFNILGCLGLSTLASGSMGLHVPGNVINFDLWVMIAVAIACLPIFAAGQRISRANGVVFLFYYVTYTAYLILMAQNYSVDLLNSIMLGFILPLTVVSVMIVFLQKSIVNQSR